jgi:hypothetical protein
MKMKKSVLLVSLLAIVAILFSCGDDDSSSDSNGSTSVASVSSYTEFQAEASKLSVDLFAECCQLDDAQKVKFQMLFSAENESIDVVAEGWADFNAAKANSCLQKAASELSCSSASPKSADCEQLLTPKQKMGDPCGKEKASESDTIISYDEVCMTGLVCGSDFVCVTAKQIGESCNDDCVANSYCDGNVCVAEEEESVMSLDQATCEQIKAFLQF